MIAAVASYGVGISPTPSLPVRRPASGNPWALAPRFE